MKYNEISESDLKIWETGIPVYDFCKIIEMVDESIEKTLILQLYREKMIHMLQGTYLFGYQQGKEDEAYNTARVDAEH